MRELYERDASVERIEVVCLCFIIIVAFTGNVSVWIIVCRSRELRTITNIFILVLSAADLLVSIVNMPLTVSAVITGSSPLSETSCTVFGYVNMLFLVTSVLSLCNISINRYVMVCRPHRFQAIYTRRNAAFMILGKYDDKVNNFLLLWYRGPLFSYVQRDQFIHGFWVRGLLNDLFSLSYITVRFCCCSFLVYCCSHCGVLFLLLVLFCNTLCPSVVFLQSA